MATALVDTAPDPTPLGAPEVVILAGGKGTRLAPLTTVLPKPLMPLGEEAILDLLLRQLSAQGFDHATLAVGHMADLVRAYCDDREHPGIELSYLKEESPLGTVGPLAFLPAQDRALLVMNGDVLTTMRFADLMRAHEESGAIATIAVQERCIQVEFGVLDLGPRGLATRTITGYREKPEMAAMVSMGVYAFRPEVRSYIERGERLDLPDLIQRLLEAGEDVGAFEFDGYWLDIGRHSDYQTALDDFAEIRPHLLNGVASGANP